MHRRSSAVLARKRKNKLLQSIRKINKLSKESFSSTDGVPPHQGSCLGHDRRKALQVKAGDFSKRAAHPLLQAQEFPFSSKWMIQDRRSFSSR